MSLGKFGKISIGWAIITVTGIYAFVLSKNTIDKQRTESLIIRNRMRKANCGEYEDPHGRKFDA